MITLITEPKDYSKKALAVYRSLGRVYFLPELRGKKISEIKKTTNILVVGISYQIDKKWIDEMPNLKVIASPATGFNHIDVPYTKKKGVKIISLRGRKSFLKNVPSTAEETMALLMAVVRNIPWAFDDVKSENWDRIAWRGHQLIGKTIGLLGFGRLGKLTARFAKTFGMKVISHDPNVTKKAMTKKGVKSVSMDELFKKSDFVSLHVLLTDKTHNLVKARQLKLMKSDSFLVNTARAEIVEKGALLKALKNKWIKGAAVDVMWDEQEKGAHLKNNPLLKYAKNNKNLIIVPHIGGATYEAMEVTQEFIADLAKKRFKK